MTITSKNNSNKSNITNLLKLCDNIENNQDSSYLINHFSESFGNIFDYKWAIIWIPFLLYTLIMLILIMNINVVNVENQIDSTTSEFLLGIYAFIIMFIIYFIVDFTYQISTCRGEDNIHTKKIILNCLYNSFFVSLAVSIGYLLAINLSNPKLNRYIDIQQISYYRNISNHKNNFIISSLFYFLTIIYINPITFEKKIISRNNLC